MSICIVSFSRRGGGNCAAIAELIRKHHGGARSFDFSEFCITPCGDCGYRCFGGRDCPYSDDKESELLEAITGSELAYFIVPNYCDFPCSDFFVFNERSCGYFQKNAARLSEYLRVPKKFVVVSNTNKANFETAFSYHCDGTPDILFLSAKEFGKISIAGDMLSADAAIEKLGKFI